jgi:hypothetical protein
MSASSRWRSIVLRTLFRSRINGLAALCLAALTLHAQTGPGEAIDYNGIHVDKASRSATFPAEINQTSGLMEYLLVNKKGKTHESLLSTAIEPYDLQVAMLLLGVKPAAPSNAQPPGQITRQYLSGAPELTGEKVSITLAWPGHRVAAESLIWDLDTNALMTPGAWTYNGSEMYGGKFLAQIDGSIAALVRDSAALVNNPRAGNDNDQIWEPYTKDVPARGTAVDVTIKLMDSATQ